MADILARQRMYSIADNATLGAAAGGLAYLLWRVAKRSLATTTATNEDKHPEAKAEVEAKVEALAKARAEAEAKAKAEAVARVKAEAEAKAAAASTGDASVAAVDLAPAAAARWTVHTSASGPNSGRKYYHDHVLKKSYWTKPDGFDGPAPQASNPAPQASNPATQASTPAPRASNPAPHNRAKTRQDNPNLCDSWSNRASNPAPKTTRADSPRQRIAAEVSMISNAVVGMFLLRHGDAGWRGSVPFFVAASAAAGVCCVPERSSHSKLARGVLWLIGRMKVGALLLVIGLAAVGGMIAVAAGGVSVIGELIVFLLFGMLGVGVGPWIAVGLVTAVPDLLAA